MKDAKHAKHDSIVISSGCEESFLGRFDFVDDVRAMNHFVVRFYINRERLCELHAAAFRNLKLVCREYQTDG
jgi:hypothetical protein